MIKKILSEASNIKIPKYNILPGRGTDRDERVSKNSKMYHAKVGKYSLVINKLKPFSAIAVTGKHINNGNKYLLDVFEVPKDLEKEFDGLNNEKEVEKFIDDHKSENKSKTLEQHQNS